jgi:hypothetical protein
LTKRKTNAKPKGEAKDEYLVVPIERWSWGFSYGLDAVSGYRPGSRSDFRHLNVFGQFLRPRRLAGPRVELTFVRSDPPEKTDSPPLVIPDHIGSLWSDPPRSRYLAVLSMPSDVLPSLLTVLAADRLRYVVMVGVQRSPRDIDVREYRFVMDDEDLPAEDTTPDEVMEELRAREWATAKSRR